MTLKCRLPAAFSPEQPHSFRSLLSQPVSPTPALPQHTLPMLAVHPGAICQLPITSAAKLHLALAFSRLQMQSLHEVMLPLAADVEI